MRWTVFALVVLGCKAELAGPGPELTGVDAALDAAAIVDASATDAPADARACAGGDARMTAPDGSCVVYFAQPRTHAAASAACAQLAARLLIIRDAGTDAVARTLVGAEAAYIGLTDDAVEGTFRWVDGSALGYTNFAAGEPNDGAGNFAEDCALVAGPRGGQWDDRPCAPDAVAGVPGEYPYLCQY